MAQAAVTVGINFEDRNNTLGREVRRGLQGINSDLKGFQTQLEYANRRVLAFGAAATTLYGSIRAFKELVNATVEVEKALTSMNTIFGLNRRELDTFSKGLFSVARQTSQSFGEVTKAAEEFARQGLNVEETAKRTRDAMILVRLTGIDSAKAVNGLTAAMSTFGKTGTDTTRIINQLVAVDQAFAVSAGGLVDAFTKVGSVVDDAGVSLEQFIGLVTAARQITARSESQIGNSLKTIFTRLERSSTLDQLEEMGVAVRDLEGNVKPALQVFDALAQSYKNMTKAQQQQVAELGAGVFQINQFKALVNDLGKANGLAAQATATAANASNEAMVRNRIANTTLAASIQNLKTSAKEAASLVGELAGRPLLEGLFGNANLGLGLFKNIKATGDTKAAEDAGAYLGESMLKGLGNFLGSTGIAFIARFVGGALRRTIPELGKDVLATGGFTSTREAEKQNLSIINGLLKNATTAERERYLAAQGVAEQEAIILLILKQQQGFRAGTIGYTLARAATPRAAEGFMGAMGAERAAISAGVGGAPGNARPVYMPTFATGGGAHGIVANNSEWMAGGTIYNRDMIRKGGLPPGATPIAAGGFVPNAAKGKFGSDLPGPLGTTGAYNTDIEREAFMRTEVLRMEKANAEFQARLLSQQAANEKAEAAIWQAERRRQTQVALNTYPINRNGEGSENIGTFGLPDMPSGSRGNPDNNLKLPRRNSTARGLSKYSAGRFATEREVAANAVREAGASANMRRISNGVLIGASAASIFGTGFIPQQGQGWGALSGGINGASTGAMVGGAFGPQGTLIGAGLGAAVGAITGFFSRVTNSFDDQAKLIEETNSKMQRQADAVQEVFKIQSDIAELSNKGGNPEVVAKQLNQLQLNLSGSLSKVTDQSLISRLLSAGGDPQKQADIIQDIASQKRSVDVRNNLSVGIGSYLNGGSKKDLNDIQDEISSSYTSMLARMGPEKANAKLIQLLNPEKALNESFQYAPARSNESFDDIQKVIQSGVDPNSGEPQYTNIREMSPDKQRRIDLIQQSFGRGYSTFMNQNLSRQINTPKQVPHITDAAMISIIASQQRDASSIGLDLESRGRIKQAKQQYILSNQALGPYGQISEQYAANRDNITDQTAEAKYKAMAAGRQKLLEALPSSERTVPLVNRIKGANTREAFESLLSDASVGNFAGSASNEIYKALLDTTGELKKIDQTSKLSLDELEKTTDYQRQQLTRDRSLDNIRDTLRTQRSLGRDVQLKGAQALLDLAPNSNLGITGSEVESASMELAMDKGQKGNMKGSFFGGFSASLRKARQDMTQFAEVGQQVAASLQSSLGSAFGDFIVGAQSGKDAFRSFAASVMQDAARAFASKGVQMLLGLALNFFAPGAPVSTATPTAVPGLLGGAYTPLAGAGPTFGVANGGYIGLANGGGVPAAVMGGEFIFTPQQASKIGPSRLSALNSVKGFNVGGLVRGGSGFKDDVFMRLAQGSYVVNKNATQALGSNNLAALAGATNTIAPSMIAGGPIGGGGSAMSVSIGVTINDNGSSSTTSKTGGSAPSKDKQWGESLGRDIAQLVDQRIAEQTRLGGMIRPRSN